MVLSTFLILAGHFALTSVKAFFVNPVNFVNVSEQFYTIEEAASQLQCSTRTIRRKLDKLDKDKLSRLDSGKLYVKASFFEAVKMLDQKTAHKPETKQPQVNKDELHQQIADLKKDLKDAKEDTNKQDVIELLQALNSRISGYFEGEVKRIQNQNDELHQRLATKDDDLKALMSKVVKLQDDKTELLQQVNQLQLTSGKDSDDQQAESLTKLQAALDDLKQQFEQKQQEHKPKSNEVTHEDGQRLAIFVCFILVLGVLLFIAFSGL